MVLTRGLKSGPAAARFDLLSMSFYWAMYLGCLGVFVTGITSRGVMIFAGTYVLRFLGISIGYHRYFAHRSFRTSRVMQFIIGAWATLGFQRGVLWWAQTHRHHHHHADTGNDVHSPVHQGFWYSHWMWGFEVGNMKVDRTRIRDLAAFPELVWLDGNGAINLVAAIYLAVLIALFGLEGLVWGFFCSTVACWQMVHWIQSFSHTVGGYRRFATVDRSRNHWLIGVLSFGEYHNNHHYYPWSAREGWAWWEPDVGYLVLKSWEAIGIIWNLKSARRADYGAIGNNSTHRDG
jgi:stearoyl-CoA desaturase (delta-9 desaturase)